MLEHVKCRTVGYTVPILPAMWLTLEVNALFIVIRPKVIKREAKSEVKVRRSFGSKIESQSMETHDGVVRVEEDLSFIEPLDGSLK